MTNSKQKGKRGELELAAVLRDHGLPARRGVQYCGKQEEGQADLVGLPGIHVECKRTERLDLEGAMAQATRDSKEDDLPAVFHRKSRRGWLVTMRLSDWLKIYGLGTGDGPGEGGES